jgi:hypothetical protein
MRCTPSSPEAFEAHETELAQIEADMCAASSPGEREQTA